MPPDLYWGPFIKAKASPWLEFTTLMNYTYRAGESKVVEVFVRDILR